MKKSINEIYIFLVMVILPLIVLPVNYQSRFCNYSFASSDARAMDYFLYIKAIVFCIITLIAFIVILKRRGMVIIKDNYMLIFMMILLCVSTFCGQDFYVSLFGADEQFEGFFVVCCYLLSCIIASEIIFTENLEKRLYRAFSILIIILFIFSLIQIILTRQKVVLTLYNSNYAGFFVAVIAPFFYECEKKINYIYLLMVFAILAMTGAKTAIVISILSFVIWQLRRCENRIKMIAYVAIFILFAIITIYVYYITYKDAGYIKNVETSDEGVVFYDGNETLRICFKCPDMEHYKFYIYDTDNIQLQYTKNEDETRYIILDKRYENYEFTIADYGAFYGFIVFVDGRTWYFCTDINGKYYYLNGYSRPDRFVVADSILFNNHEAFATNRGYIWSRSIPLIFKNLPFGVGLDNFAIVFPNNDVNKYLRTDFPYKMIITRPHSIYLQILIQNGVIYFAMLMIFIARILYYSKGNRKLKASVIVFLLCGLMYDSCICITPIVFVILGLLKSGTSDKMLTNVTKL